MAAGKQTNRFRVAMFQQQIEIVKRHLLVLFSVDDQHGRTGLIEPALVEQGKPRHDGAKLVKGLLTKEIGAGFDEIEQIGIGVARAFLPLRLEKIVDAAAPIDRGAQLFRRDVSELGRPMAAKAGADHSDLATVHLRSF